MIKESPIFIDDVKFRDYSRSENPGDSNEPVADDYEGAHDFVTDEDFDGISAEIVFANSMHLKEPKRGVRRKVRLTLIDTTGRFEVASRLLPVNIGKAELHKTFYQHFDAESLGLQSGHTYKMLLEDTSADELLGEHAFHLYSADELGHPSGWYTPACGAIRKQESTRLYKSLDFQNYDVYNVRFELEHNFGFSMPHILPELEIRLMRYDGEVVPVQRRYLEPQRSDIYGGGGTYAVELPFLMMPAIRGLYYAELLCMRYPIAGFLFETDEDEEGQWTDDELVPIDLCTPENMRLRWEQLHGKHEECDEDGAGSIISDDSFDRLLDEFIASQNQEDPDEGAEEAAPTVPAMPEPLCLEQMTGLRAVKEKLAVYERVVRFNKLRADSGLPISPTPMHAMFLGSPGTGKTTVAMMMGRMLQRAGMLSRGHVVVRERANLIGYHYNSEGENTLKAINEAQGGILFIDEAYQLYQPQDARDPGKFVIETLLTTLADPDKNDWMLILAGYPDEMRRLFDMNPGFKSRIPESNIYNFEDFREEELMEIANRYLARHSYSLTPEADAALARRLNADYEHRDRTFGNARHVISLIQTQILPAMAVRVTDAGLTAGTALTEIQAADIPAPASPAVRPSRVGFLI